MATLTLTACLAVGSTFAGIGLYNLQAFLERSYAEQHAKD